MLQRFLQIDMNNGSRFVDIVAIKTCSGELYLLYIGANLDYVEICVDLVLVLVLW